MGITSTGRDLLALIALGALLAPGGAAAQTIRIVDEVKVGVMAHDIGLFDHAKESGADINGEILFASPGFLDFIGAPRPHLGGEVNTDGNTDNFYFGLTWGLPIFDSLVGQSDALTIYGSLGGSLNDGFQDNAPAGRKNLGSVILFRESLELGYQVTSVNSVSILFDHISNANLANHNGGITNIGARLGFKF